MLLNKIYKIIGIISLLLFLVCCGKKDSKPVNYNDMRAIKNLAAQLIDKEIKFSGRILIGTLEISNQFTFSTIGRIDNALGKP